jgi:hypothetical protein
MRIPLGIVLASLLVAASFPISAAPLDELEANLRELRAQIEKLQTRQQELERDLAEQRAAAASTASVAAAADGATTPRVAKPAAADPQGDAARRAATTQPRNVFTDAIPGAPMAASLRALQLPGTDAWLRIGGMLKVDAIDDLGQVMGDSSAPGSLAVDGPSAQRTQGFRMLARQSRLFVDTSMQIGPERLHTLIEGDFYGAGGGTAAGTNAYTFALRHAYAEYGSYLLGQTWSTFLDLETQPENLDNSGPTGRSAIRQPMVRYTRAFGPVVLQAAIENPESDFDGADYAVGNVKSQNIRNRYPDLVGSWRFGGDWGHVRLASVVRSLGVQDGQGVSASATGWGVQFAGILKAPGSNSFGWQLNGGRGIGRYLQDATSYGADLTPQGRLVPQFASGGLVSWQHAWSPRWRSNVFAGITSIENRQPIDPGVASTLTRRLFQTSLNVIWSPLSGVNLGGQFTHFERDVESDEKVDANRLQFAAWYFF